MCKWCEQKEDGGIDFRMDVVELGALGTMEVTMELWNYKLQDKAFLLFDVWLNTDTNQGKDLSCQKAYIAFCPFCGRKLSEVRDES